MTIESALATLFVVFLYVIKPGPSILVVISRSLGDGFAAGFTVALGNTTAHIIYLMLAIFGYALIEMHLEFASFFLKSLGAAYLIYIGIKGLLNLEAGAWGENADQALKITPVEHYFSGLTICLSSPYTVLFYIAIIPQMLPINSFTAIDIFIATALIAGAYLALQTTVSFLCDKARNTLMNENIVRRVNYGVSCIFIGIGLIFLATMFPIMEFSLNLLK